MPLRALLSIALTRSYSRSDAFSKVFRDIMGRVYVRNFDSRETVWPLLLQFTFRHWLALLVDQGMEVREPVFMRLVNEDEAQSPPRLFKRLFSDAFKVFRKLFSNFCGYILELVTMCFAFKPYTGIWPDRVCAKPCAG